jgi:hypothetical protein
LTAVADRPARIEKIPFRGVGGCYPVPTKLILGRENSMSDYASMAEIERHNVRMARLIRDYWRKQGVALELNGDPTKELRSILGPGGLPRGYRGQDALPAKRGRP